MRQLISNRKIHKANQSKMQSNGAANGLKILATLE